MWGWGEAWRRGGEGRGGERGGGGEGEGRGELQWNLTNSNTQGTKIVQLTESCYRLHMHTSVQGPQTLVKLMKDSTKGIVDLKRVHSINLKFLAWKVIYVS